MNPATATRQEIRDFVKANSEEVAGYAQQGGNPQHKVLDQKDRLEARLADVTDEERARFYLIYSEELQANSHALLEDSQRALQADLKRVHGGYSTTSWVVAFIILLVTAIVFIKH